MSFPGTDTDEEGRPLKGQPIEKARGWMNDFGLSLLGMQCFNGGADSLCWTIHDHYHARGNYSDAEAGRRPKLSQYTAKYTPEESACYAASVRHAIDERLER